MEFYIAEMKDLKMHGSSSDCQRKVLRVKETRLDKSYDYIVREVRDAQQARECVKPENVLTTLHENIPQIKLQFILLPHKTYGYYKFCDEIISLKGYSVCQKCDSYVKDIAVYKRQNIETGERLPDIALCEMCAEAYRAKHPFILLSKKEEKHKNVLCIPLVS